MPSLLIWGHANPPPTAFRNVILWRSFTPEGAPSSWLSLPTETTVRRENLISDYRDLMQAFGESKVGTQGLTHFTQIRPGLSYWWMSLPSMHSLEVASVPFTLVRIMLLVQIITEKRPEALIIAGLPRDVSRLVYRWARARGIKVNIQKQRSRERVRLRSRVVTRFPSLAAFRVFTSHLQVMIRGRNDTVMEANGSDVTVVDYTVPKKSPEPQTSLNSTFWGPLPQLLSDLSISSNFIHMPASLATAENILADTHEAPVSSESGNRHARLYSELNWRVFFRTVQDYFRLRRMGRSLLKHKRAFEDVGAQIPVAEVLRPALLRFFFGRDAALNSFTINLWDNLLSRLPPQRLGLYLFENQPWEFAFQSSWRRNNHGTLVGVPHSTLVDWDLRIFGHAEYSLGALDSDSMPWPDFVAVNGNLMKNRALRAGYPQQRLLEVESLRFQRQDFPGPRTADYALILGEYSTIYNDYLLHQTRTKGLTQELPAVFRPHPQTGLGDLDSRALAGIRVWDGDLTEALTHAALAVVGSHTSASIDAWLSGIPTLIVSHPEAFGTCPAEGLPGVSFLSDTDPVRMHPPSSSSLPDTRHFLHISSDLTRWRHVIPQLLD